MTIDRVRELFRLCDLMRLPGVKSIRANLYLTCGYEVIGDFTGKNAVDVQKNMARIIAEKELTQSVPLLKELKTQIAVASVLPELYKVANR